MVQHILTSQKKRMKRVKRERVFDAHKKNKRDEHETDYSTHLELIGGGGGGNSDAMDDGSASFVFRDSRY